MDDTVRTSALDESSRAFKPTNVPMAVGGRKTGSKKVAEKLESGELV